MVYDAYEAALRPLVARHFASPFEREEAAQEIWLHVHRMASAFDPARGELLPWLRTVATNRCREILRARGRRPGSDEEVDPERLPADLVETETPEERARQHRMQQAVAAFVAGLDSEEAAVFRYSVMDERTHEEVASAVGITARRAKYLRSKLLARALEDPRLRAVLEEVRGP